MQTTANFTRVSPLYIFVQAVDKPQHENGAPMAFAYYQENGTPVYYFYETNIQGDIIYVYNENGVRVLGYRYNAYGWSADGKA